MAFARIFNSSHTQTSSLHSSQSLKRLCKRLTITMTATAFWKNGSLAKCVLWEISSAYIHTKIRGIEATCIVSGDK